MDLQRTHLPLAIDRKEKIKLQISDFKLYLKLLFAISRVFPEMGYCQGLNNVVCLFD